MKIFPAIDLFDKKAVRLYKGNFDEMTVYSNDPPEIAYDFKAAGAEWIHVVDLEGARDGTTPNIEVVEKIAKSTGLKVEVGGGIRSMEVLDRYFRAGVSRAIIGTSAISDPDFLLNAVKKYGDKIAVGADVRDGYIAIKGWVEKTATSLEDFIRNMVSISVKTVICTDISRDGAMRGTNLEMYRTLSEKFHIDIIASGGVSTIADVCALRDMNLYGAIIGKAYYTGAIDLKEAIRITK